MRCILSCASLAAGISLLAAAPVLGQTPAALPSVAPVAYPPQDSALGNKEKAQDAALLQQLEAGTQPAQNEMNPGRQLWAPAAGARAGGFGMGIGSPGLPYRGQTLLARPTAAPKELLVRTSNPEPKAQAALEEDLAVMAHLLVKALDAFPSGQTRPMNVLGIELAFPGSPAPMRSLYLDNYGAVFFLSVGFPLVAPPEKQQAEEKPAADSAWEDARQELYGQRLQGATAGEPAEDYSQEKVEKLKTTLLDALKNATNIRELKPDEFVTIWVGGGVTGGPARHRVFKNNPLDTLGGNFEVIEPASASRRTILTIRVSKTEIDAYAKGRLAAQEFQKHARITAYTEESAGAGPDGALGGGFYTGRARF